MPVTQNKLQDEQSINEYKKWLSNKPNHYLKCLLHLFQREGYKDESNYYKINLRIELVEKEIEKRLDIL